MAGHLEPFTRVQLQLARGRDLWIVTQAETVEAYLAVRADLTRTGYAACALELLDRFSYEEESPNPSVYRLLIETLERLGMETDPQLAVRYFKKLECFCFTQQMLQPQVPLPGPPVRKTG